MASDVEVFGIASLQKDLQRISSKMNKKDLAKLLRPGAVIIQREMKSIAPSRTGALRKAIRVRIARGKADDPRATVETYFGKTYPYKGTMVKPYYNYFVENGTVERFRFGRKVVNGRKVKDNSRRIPTGAIKAVRFVWRAFDSKVDEAARIILDNIAKSVEQ